MLVLVKRLGSKLVMCGAVVAVVAVEDVVFACRDAVRAVLLLETV